MTTSFSSVGRGTIRSIACAGAVLALLSTGTSADQAIDRGDDDMAGVVSGPRGPEAGVWVIAETTDLATKFVRIVVTDDQGRYLDARLAEGDLQRVGARLRPRRFAEGRRRRRARRSTSTAVAAPNARAAAAVLSRRATGSRCSRCRDKSEFPGTGRAATASRRTSK